MENKSKLECRKCGGGHLTIKCNQNKQISNVQGGQINTEQNNRPNNTEQNNRPNNTEQNNYNRPNNTEQNNYNRPNYNRTNNNQTSYTQSKFVHYKQNKVKISDLPTNISESELQELLYDWGNVTKIVLKKYSDNATAYITFKFEIEVDYLVSALDGTNFEYKIIHVEKLDS
jgi:monoamine oxidase